MLIIILTLFMLLVDCRFVSQNESFQPSQCQIVLMQVVTDQEQRLTDDMPQSGSEQFAKFSECMAFTLVHIFQTFFLDSSCFFCFFFKKNTWIIKKDILQRMLHKFDFPPLSRIRHTTCI